MRVRPALKFPISGALTLRDKTLKKKLIFNLKKKSTFLQGSQIRQYFIFIWSITIVFLYAFSVLQHKSEFLAYIFEALGLSKG